MEECNRYPSRKVKCVPRSHQLGSESQSPCLQCGAWTRWPCGRNCSVSLPRVDYGRAVGTRCELPAWDTHVECTQSDGCLEAISSPSLGSSQLLPASLPFLPHRGRFLSILRLLRAVSERQSLAVGPEPQLWCFCTDPREGRCDRESTLTVKFYLCVVSPSVISRGGRDGGFSGTLGKKGRLRRGWSQDWKCQF